MNRPRINDLLVFVLLVTLGVVARVAFQYVPNFAPVAGIALFAGYFFGHRLLAIAAPLTIMLISDRLVEAGGYALPLMLTVYTLLALPVLLSRFVRRYFTFDQPSAGKAFQSVAGLMASSLACSLIFFLGTNFAVWATSSWYEPTFAGLVSCYTSAIPFFRYTLAGDAIFATTLFGSYAAIRLLANRDSKALVTS